MSINVFLSVGRTFTDPQEKFVTAIEAHLTSHGFRPRTVGRTDFTHKRPLMLIDDLMNCCAAALIIALERISIEQGLEKRGSPQEVALAQQYIPTPWNQIEAAFAYAKGLPIMVVKEAGLRADGLLETGYDWYVHTTPLTSEFLKTPDFLGTFESWSKDARQRAGLFRYRR